MVKRSPQLVVLGIDAAWTDTHPSGVAVIEMTGGRWQLVAVAPTYECFVLSADAPWVGAGSPRSADDPAGLVDATERLAGRRPDLIAVDMPLSCDPITGRRASDDAVSRAYGVKWCGTHSPTRERPGTLSAWLRDRFAATGYRLETTTIAAPCLIEVYPCPAVVELLRAPYRLPYKIGKIIRYWPNSTPDERHLRLRAFWRTIVAALDREVGYVAASLPIPGPEVRGKALKAFEDQLDAVVCAWVGCQSLSGRAKPYGNSRSAIWIPTQCGGRETNSPDS